MRKLQAIGNIGRDPELRYLESGTAVLNFSIAAEDGWGDKKSNEWVRCALWGKRAEGLEPHLGKGQKVFVEGRLDVRTYEKDGETRVSLECNVDKLEFMGSAGGGNQGNPGAETDADQSFDDDDIPF